MAIPGRSSRGRRFIAILAAALAASALGTAGSARADTPFTARFSADAEGGIALAANTLESCPADASGCPAAREGRGSLLDDNDFAMRLVDVDHDPATDDSSSARLRLPAGARVLFAGLYDGARTEAGTRGAAPAHPTAETLARVWLRGPGQDGYSQLGSTGATVTTSDEVRGAYQAFHDVTDLVRRDGAGEYTVADVPAATGVDRYAGWALVVAYAAPGDPPRNLSVFDGLQSVSRGRPSVTIPVSGFQTPVAGPVRTQVGFVAYEGDLGSGGDGVSLDGRTLSDAASPPSNFFDSGISIDGAPATDKVPDYRNQLGFDAKLTRADGILANGATGADIALRTSLEQYLTGAVTFATDLHAPDVMVDKSVENLSAPGQAARPGDRLQYTIVYRDRGAEAAPALVADDTLPAGESLVPGSLRIAQDGRRLAPTDVAGDDLGEYDAPTRTVRFFLGEGATPSAGGTLVAGAEATVSLQAEVDPTDTATTLSNAARATFEAPALQRPLTAVSTPAQIEVRPQAGPVAVADLQVADRETQAAGPAGDEVLDTVTVTDRGPDDATGIHVQARASSGGEVQSARADTGTCAVVAGAADCVVDHLDAGGSAQIEIVQRASGATEDAGAPTEVTAAAHQLDEDAADNAVRATAPAPTATQPAVDAAQLSTTVHASRLHATVGEAVDDRIVVHDRGPGTATGVVVQGATSAPLAGVRIRATGGLRCAMTVPLHCVAARLRPGATATILVTGRPLRAGPMRWAATATSDRVDPRPGLDTGDATTVVRPARTSLALAVGSAPSTIDPGGATALRLAVRNRTAAAARGISLCVALPGSVRVLRAGSARRRGGRLCWSWSALAGHGRRVAVARIAAASSSAGGPLAFVATVRADGAAPVTRQAVLDVRRTFTACGAPAAAPAGLTLAAPDC